MEGNRNSKAHGFKWLDSITNSVDVNWSKHHETMEPRGPGRAAVHRAGKSWTQLRDGATTKLSLSTAGCVRGAARDWGTCLCVLKRLHERCVQRRQEGASLESGHGLQRASSTRRQSGNRNY